MHAVNNLHAKIMNTFPVTNHAETDTRYTITREFDGHQYKRYIARFCGEWIGGRATYGGAVMLATGHNQRRKGALVIEEVSA